ncbi:MAG: GTPase ObgE [Spirochaetia bacterium]|nr:GTPase ObgE [Spirochaetia bacterium]
MKFIDEIEIHVKAGNGGPGAVHFLHEKYREFGGPDGGDGGKGGDIYLKANSGIQTLGHLLKKEIYKAENGEAGKSRNKSGKSGEDLILQVPQGTVVEDADSGEILGDLTFPDSSFLAVKGGKGGLGNQHFATSVNQAPLHAKPGFPGEEKFLRLNLKLIADAGLIGLPNAGKSTLLSVISKSHPRIADYAFTTLTPNLGVITGDDNRRLIVADIPGIIEGAHRGAGLGLSFLRHIERVEVILYVLDITSVDPAEDLRTLQTELASYSEALTERPVLVLLNKMDCIDYDSEFAVSISEKLKSPEFWKKTGQVPEFIFISAKEKKGLEKFYSLLFDLFQDVSSLAEKMLPGWKE